MWLLSLLEDKRMRQKGTTPDLTCRRRCIDDIRRIKVMRMVIAGACRDNGSEIPDA